MYMYAVINIPSKPTWLVFSKFVHITDRVYKLILLPSIMTSVRNKNNRSKIKRDNSRPNRSGPVVVFSSYRDAPVRPSLH